MTSENLRVNAASDDGRRTRRLLASASIAAVAVCLLTAPAFAQSVATDAPPPVRSSIDANGVNLISGTFNLNDTQVSVGQPGQGGLSRAYFAGTTYGATSRDNLSGTINSTGSTYTVSVGSISIPFTLSGSTFTSQLGDGSTMTLSGSNYTVTFRDGTVGVFSNTHASTEGILANVAQISSLTKPNGEVDTYTYSFHSQYISPYITISGWRLDAVTNNYGYEIKYIFDTSSNNVTDFIITQIIGINNAVDYCAPSATSCAGLTVTWPSVTFGVGTGVMTDVLGRQTTYFSPVASSTQKLIRPSGATLTVIYDSSARVTSIANGVGTWSYSYSDSGSIRTTTVTDPNGHTRVMVSNTSTGFVNSDTDGLSHTTTYTPDSFNRVQKITNPQNDYITYTYDGRGNINQVTVTGTDLASTLTTTANYDTTCTNPVKCNQPNWKKDARNNETDYTYSPTTGQVTSVIAPNGANGIRPETDLSYTSLYAYYKNSAGSIVAAASPISLHSTLTQCSTAQTCVGSSNATVATISFGSSGVANNLLPITITRAAGDGSLSATTTVAYDSVGNISTIADPLSNITKYWFDGDREPLGSIGPDPDGAGALKNRATRYTYECDGSLKSGCDGLVTSIEQGTTASQSAADWAAFSSLSQRYLRYDSIDRFTSNQLANGSSANSYLQYTYDNANRLMCSTNRMNAATLSSLPSSACTLATAGSYGPDRISYITYDNADRPLKLTIGYGTTSQVDEVTNTLGADGELLTQADAKGNLTTYIMDAFNRTSKIEFPTASNGSVSSTTDYEQYTYDANSNLTQDRRRDGTAIIYGIDANNLVTTGYNGATYGYDNLGRRTSAYYGSVTTTFAYDALGRQITENGPLGIVSRQFDLNGNETRLTYPDGYYDQYYYDTTNALTGIVDNTSLQLYGAAYDNLGRQANTYRQYGPTATFAYGSDFRLSSIGYVFADGSKSVTFSYGYDLAGGIESASPSNSLYSWSPSGSALSYGVDGQNKYSTVGASTLSYDGRANLSYDGVATYGYDALNRLVSSGSASLSYDGLGRLYQTVGSSTTKFLYDGAQIIGEYNSSGTLLNRYVPDVGLDQPLIWFPGTGTAYTNALWPLVDGAASIAAVSTTGPSNTTYGINTYDAYGKAGSGNVGRFQFKGMPWIPEVGQYHDRARAYNPALGRFMQSDPIGYGDGMNFYNFGRADPVNHADSSGLAPYECGKNGAPPCELVVVGKPPPSATIVTSNPTPPSPIIVPGLFPAPVGQVASATANAVLVVTARKRIVYGKVTVQSPIFGPDAIEMQFPVIQNIPAPPTIKVPGPNPKPNNNTTAHTGTPSPFPPPEPPEDPLLTFYKALASGLSAVSKYFGG